MVVISYSEALKTLDEFAKKYNKSRSLLSNQLRQSTLSTAKDLIRLYGLELARIKYKPSYPLPPLRTNNKYLAKLGNTSSRTVQRHLKKLQKAGIITKKQWRGSRASYDIWLLPELLCINVVQAVEKPKNDEKPEKTNTTENQLITTSKTTTCPHRDTSNNSYINNIIIEVHKSKNITESIFQKTSNTLTRYTEGKVPKKQYEAEGKVRTERVTKQTSDKSTAATVARRTSLIQYVEKLWTYSQKELYRDIPLTDGQIKTAKRLLYKWYEPVSVKNLDHTHQVYIERIKIVRKYLDKDPKRFVQLPNRFFDPNNPSGFTGTKKWYNKSTKQKNRAKKQLAVQIEILKVTYNEKLDTAFQEPRLELFRLCETRVKKLNNQGLLKHFYKSVFEFMQG